MKIRPITIGDFDEVLLLLCEGFPRRSRSYWQTALEKLRSRPEVPGMTPFGHLIEDGGKIEGLMLTINTDFGGDGSGSPSGRRSNHSSWYVRPDARKYATFLIRAALRPQGVAHLDLSPTAHVRDIVAALGFVPYTAGSILLDPRVALRGGGSIGRYRPDLAEPDLRKAIDRHIGYGCRAIAVGPSRMPALYRTRMVKRIVPAAQFLWGDPATLIDNGSALMRHLLARGVALAFIDAPRGFRPGIGRLLPDRGVRYVAGGQPPAAGDLLETELAVFGP